MSSRTRNIVIIAFCVLVFAWIALIVYMLSRDSSSDGVATTADARNETTANSDYRDSGTDTSSDMNTETIQTVTVRSAPNHGPFTTMEAAVKYVQSQGDELMVNNPGTTWQPASTLHVLYAKPVGGLNAGSSFYFFFVDGYLVGQNMFTQSQTGQVVDGTTFTVTYNVYLPGDSQCCPKGGASTVNFHWDGTELVPSGSLQGATL